MGSSKGNTCIEKKEVENLFLVVRGGHCNEDKVLRKDHRLMQV